MHEDEIFDHLDLMLEWPSSLVSVSPEYGFQKISCFQQRESLSCFKIFALIFQPLKDGLSQIVRNVFNI